MFASTVITIATLAAPPAPLVETNFYEWVEIAYLNDGSAILVCAGPIVVGQSDAKCAVAVITQGSLVVGIRCSGKPECNAITGTCEKQSEVQPKGAVKVWCDCIGGSAK